MGFLDNLFAPADNRRISVQESVQLTSMGSELAAVKEQLQMQASFLSDYGGTYEPVYVQSYNGEKNYGEAGPIIEYEIDYYGLRARSWQYFLESEIAQTGIKRHVLWSIGSGLKLQSEPEDLLLQSEKIQLDKDVFSRMVESRFKVYGNSKMADLAGMVNLHRIAERAKLNAIVGGDVLIVLRYIGDVVKVQLIDGAHICNPLGFANSTTDGLISERNNRIIHGVEVDEYGTHVGFHVRTRNYKTEYIPAYGKKSGHLMAFLFGGLEYKLDGVRCMPLLCSVMESIKKLERYKEAAVGGAEERMKVPWWFKHDINSTGENPMAKNVTRLFNRTNTNDNPVTFDGKALANDVLASYNKKVINMPVGATMEAFDAKQELSFKDFYTVNSDIVFATIGIPPDVAKSKYDSNYSASRAAIKDWEHSLKVDRKKTADGFYQPIFNLWLDGEVLSNKIQAPGYLEARSSGNQMILEAYRAGRFEGANVPHIDPLKEVQAERMKLGDSAANIPLTTVEQATENLNGGDSDANMKQYARELKDALAGGIPAPPAPPKPGGPADDEK